MSFLNWITQFGPCKRQQMGAFLNTKGSVRRKKDVAISQMSRSFLDLPTEIRLMIYEAIFTPASVVLQSGELPAIIAVLQNFPELISRGSRDVQLFRTCKTCHDEAIPIFYGSLNLLVYQHLPLLRLNFLPRIGPFNASFIKTAIITPIGLPGEDQRLLESLGSRHGGLVGMEHLTIEIWDPSHVPALISTCQELMQRHTKLKTLFGRGIDLDGQPQIGDIPATLKLARAGRLPGHRRPPESQSCYAGTKENNLVAVQLSAYTESETQHLILDVWHFDRMFCKYDISDMGGKHLGGYSWVFKNDSDFWKPDDRKI